jgi:hypothetical protein
MEGKQMGPAADVALLTGAITVANEVLFAPLAGNHVAFNWRVIPATGIFALLMDGLEKLSPQVALGISVTALVTALFLPLGKAGSPVNNASKALGYGG